MSAGPRLVPLSRQRPRISRRDPGAASNARARTSALEKTRVVDFAEDVFDLPVAQEEGRQRVDPLQNTRSWRCGSYVLVTPEVAYRPLLLAADAIRAC